MGPFIDYMNVESDWISVCMEGAMGLSFQSLDITLIQFLNIVCIHSFKLCAHRLFLNI
jgi:hypothetical protein